MLYAKGFSWDKAKIKPFTTLSISLFFVGDLYIEKYTKMQSKTERVQDIDSMSKDNIPIEFIRLEHEQPEITTVHGNILECPTIDLVNMLSYINWAGKKETKE